MYANTHARTHREKDRVSEGAGHQNYKVGQNKHHDTTANEEQLNCSI